MKNLKLQIVCFLLMLLSISGLAQLTGFWMTDVGGCYQVRQEGNVIWWSGESPDVQRSSNVFRGVIAGENLTGIWCDMPSNPYPGCGESISLRLETNNRMLKVSSSAPYQGSVWTRQSGPCIRGCSFNLSNLPEKFKAMPSGSTKYSVYSRIGNSNEYSVEYFDGASKYADRKERIYRDGNSRLVLETFSSDDNWFCTLTGNIGADCEGSFDCKKSSQVSQGSYTLEILEP